MMSMKQMVTHWKKVEKAEDQDEKEIQFQQLLQTHHPELLSSNKNLTDHNCQILHDYITQLQRVRKEIKNKKKIRNNRSLLKLHADLDLRINSNSIRF
jgi:hypothetical protein